jgi:hypothetical protein
VGDVVLKDDLKDPIQSKSNFSGTLDHRV